MRSILLVAISTSWLLSADIVVINQTRLIWQDNRETKSIKKDWEGAKVYCQELTFAGESDWRLPSIKELQFIVDTKRVKPAVKKSFRNVASKCYWSSSQKISASSLVWSVCFESGYTDAFSKDTVFYIRCVRDKQ